MRLSPPFPPPIWLHWILRRGEWISLQNVPEPACAADDWIAGLGILRRRPAPPSGLTGAG